jgi:hypothetical protein
MGYGRIGEIVGQHVWLNGEGNCASLSEEEVVNYADKRVRHGDIVSIEERFQDLKDRYGKDQPAIDYLDRMEKTIRKVEDKIFLILEIHPDEICRHLQGEGVRVPEGEP